MGSSERLMVALLLQQMVVGMETVCSMLFKGEQSQMPSFEASNAALVYLALQEEVATVFCFLACNDITPDPKEYV